MAKNLFFLPIACEYLGGKLARLLGLDVAKYQYAIDEFDRNDKVLPDFLFKFCQEMFMHMLLKC